MQDELPEGLNAEAWADWVEDRKERKKPMTKRAKKLAMGKLLKHTLEHQRTMVDAAIERGWTGIWEIPYAENRLTGNPAANGRKLTPAERARAARAGAGSSGVGGLDSVGGNVRQFCGNIRRIT